jgi:uncharacterized protein
MGERTSYTPGTFCWTDLGTSDQEGAKRFYGELFGWEYEDRPAGEGVTYSIARIGDRSVAAIAPLPPRQEGVPPHWNSYVAVDDADAAAARARELGGEVLGEPFDVFDAGRMAAVRDPQGGGFMLWQARDMVGARFVNAPGALSWNELLTTDPQAAQEFYGGLFGWTFDSMEGAMGQPYWVIRNGDRGNGGLMPQPPELAGSPPVWTVYFGTDSVDDALASAQRLGGGVMMPATSLADGQMRIGVAHDPAGAAFALFAGQFEE